METVLAQIVNLQQSIRDIGKIFEGNHRLHKFGVTYHSQIDDSSMQWVIEEVIINERSLVLEDWEEGTVENEVIEFKVFDHYLGDPFYMMMVDTDGESETIIFNREETLNWLENN